MRALVTGGTGFVGANLVRRLLADGDEVHLVLREDARLWRIDGLIDHCTVHHGDVTDRSFVREASRAAQASRIFHLAVCGAYSFETDLADIAATNVVGTANLIAAALEHGCEVFVNTGSSSEYGDCDHAPDEDEPTRPNSYYSATKACSTALCDRAAVSDGLPAVTLRLYSVYGPWEDERRLMPTLVSNCLAGRWPRLAGPQTVRDFVYVDDVVDAYLRVAAATPAERRRRIYNVGSGQETSLGELVAIASDVFDMKAAPEFSSYPQREWDTRRWLADSRRIREDLDWAPGTPIRAGLERMAAWMASRSALAT